MRIVIEASEAVAGSADVIDRTRTLYAFDVSTETSTAFKELARQAVDAALHALGMSRDKCRTFSETTITNIGGSYDYHTP